jgi:hypothetical protein
MASRRQPNGASIEPHIAVQVFRSVRGVHQAAGKCRGRARATARERIVVQLKGPRVRCANIRSALRSRRLGCTAPQVVLGGGACRRMHLRRPKLVEGICKEVVCPLRPGRLLRRVEGHARSFSPTIGRGGTSAVECAATGYAAGAPSAIQVPRALQIDPQPSAACDAD